MPDASVAVMWFRRDLRLADNPALLEAWSTHDEVLPLFVHDDRLRGPSGAPRLSFLRGCLAALDESLSGNLVCRAGEPASVVADVARECGAATIYCAEDFGPYGTERDDAVEAALAADQRELRRIGSSYAVPPGTVFTGSGTPFKVFTPFSRAWRAHGWDEPADPPVRPKWTTGVRSDGLPDAPALEAELPEPGERAASARAHTFLSDDVDRYGERRNDPGADQTSRLSAHLKFGCIHPRQLLARLGRSKGARTFANELCWRDFYADVLYHRPDTARQPFVAKMEAMPADHGTRADERFHAWSQGRTGYPIVDAGMRQLLAEGWMHNRVRMITASFLVKDLHLTWQRGASWFLEHLVDGDLASNNHGWQWVAGSGTDAAPYFRVFNPVSQGRRFDPDGEYVRRWVPELRGIKGPAIHEPRIGSGDDLFATPDADEADAYPGPIVDHATERKESLRRYESL
ncbi:MAG: DNA photolyase family protein [Actinomycetota bacterium]|nr:DNA photolyase family protein [Actinomycetota bacterium]